MLKNVALATAQIATVVSIILAWQLFASKGWVDIHVVGEPGGIAETLGTWLQSGSLFVDLGSTLVVLGLGYGMGLVAGAALGALLGLSPFARAVLGPFVVFFNGMPRILLYPLLVVILGFGLTAQVTLVVLSVVVLVAVAIASGFSEIPKDLIDNMRLMGATRWDVARQVYLPSLTLWILSTSRMTIGYAFSAVVVAEFVGATEGLGFQVVQAQAELDVNAIWAAIVVIVIVAIVVYGIIGVIERRATRWLPA